MDHEGSDEEVSGSDKDQSVRSLINDNIVASGTRTHKLVIKRQIGLLQAVAMMVGGIIGGGLFISPRIVLSNSGSVGLTFIVWLAAGAISLLGGLCYCEWTSLVGKSGGNYVYLKFAYGDLAAFLYCWQSVWLCDPGYNALSSLGFSLYVTKAFYSSEAPVWLVKVVAASAVLMLAFLNCVSARWSLRVQVVFCASKILAIGAITVIGIVRLVKGHTSSLSEPFSGSTYAPGAIGHAFYSAMYAYSGWSDLSFVTEEIKKPKKNFPRAIMISIPLVTACYILVNLAFFSVLSQEEYLSSEAVALTFANKLNGRFGTIMPLIVAFSVFGSLNASIFYGARQLSSMSMEKQMPYAFALVHKKSHTPIPAIALRTLLCLLMIIPSNIESLLNWVTFLDWFIYFFIFVALIVLRFTKPDLPRSYKVNLGIAVLMVIVSLYFMIVPFLTNPVEAAYGLVVLASGVPVYYVFIAKSWVPPGVSFFLSKLASCAQMVCNVSMPERCLED